MLVPVLCGLDLLMLAVGCVLAWRGPRAPAPVDAVRVVTFAAVAALVVAPPALLLAGSFALLRGMTHALFCVSLPVAAVRGVRVLRQQPVYGALLLSTFVVGEACYVWAREVEPFRLEVTRRTVTSERLRPVVATLGRPLRVACLADLQTDAIGAYEVRVFDELVRLEPDLVLMLGDYLQVDPARARELRPALHEQLARLRPPYGIYAVDGDVDGVLGGARGAFAGTAVRALVDEWASVPGLPVSVLGLSRTRSRAPFVDAGTARRMSGEHYPIVIGHAPDFMLSVVRDGYDPDALMVAGHTHGGQVQVPGFGPIVTLTAVPRWLAGGGVFRRGATWLVCSRGVGLERSDAPRIRFWCRPQLILLELGDGTTDG